MNVVLFVDNMNLVELIKNFNLSYILKYNIFIVQNKSILNNLNIKFLYLYKKYI